MFKTSYHLARMKWAYFYASDDWIYLLSMWMCGREEMKKKDPSAAVVVVIGQLQNDSGDPRHNRNIIYHVAAPSTAETDCRMPNIPLIQLLDRRNLSIIYHVSCSNGISSIPPNWVAFVRSQKCLSHARTCPYTHALHIEQHNQAFVWQKFHEM